MYTADKAQKSKSQCLSRGYNPKAPNQTDCKWVSKDSTETVTPSPLAPPTPPTEKETKVATKIQAAVRGDQTRTNVSHISGKNPLVKNFKKSSGKKSSGKHGKHCISKYHEQALSVIEKQFNIVLTDADKDILIEHAKKFPDGGCQTIMKKNGQNLILKNT